MTLSAARRSCQVQNLKVFVACYVRLSDLFIMKSSTAAKAADTVDKSLDEVSGTEGHFIDYDNAKAAEDLANQRSNLVQSLHQINPFHLQHNGHQDDNESQ